MKQRRSRFMGSAQWARTYAKIVFDFVDDNYDVDNLVLVKTDFSYNVGFMIPSVSYMRKRLKEFALNVIEDPSLFDIYAEQHDEFWFVRVDIKFDRYEKTQY